MTRKNQYKQKGERNVKIKGLKTNVANACFKL